MCFYDRTIFSCSDYKFGNFKQHCDKATDSGESCGVKMLMADFNGNSQKCTTCIRIEGVLKTRQEACVNISRWQKDEKNGLKRSGEIEVAFNAIDAQDGELKALYKKLETHRAGMPPLGEFKFLSFIKTAYTDIGIQHGRLRARTHRIGLLFGLEVVQNHH